jgi:S-adenosylmethionine/arginine decarboxylase-like enzyme
MFKPYHQHLLIKGNIRKAVKSTERINEWFRELVTKVGMVVVAGPTSVYIDDLGNEGLTGTVTLATSHASIHIWDATDPMCFQFDIYSCKCYDIKTVIDHLNDEFDMIDFQWIEVDRNDDMKIADKGHGKGSEYWSDYEQLKNKN